MNIQASTKQAEGVRLEGNAIYKKLLPALKKKGIEAGHFVAINIETQKYVIAADRLALISAYRDQFGHAAGWVRRIDYVNAE